MTDLPTPADGPDNGPDEGSDIDLGFWTPTPVPGPLAPSPTTGPTAPADDGSDVDLGYWTPALAAVSPPEPVHAAPGDVGPATDGPAGGRTTPFDASATGRDAPTFDEGARDGRYEPVGVNRRVVLGLSLGFVAFVLLALLTVTGDEEPGTDASDGPRREAAVPEFIERPLPTEAPAFADPEPFAYEPAPYGSAPVPDPYAPDPYAPDPYASAGYATYDVPDDRAPDRAQRPGSATPTRDAPPPDPRIERYLRARSSALMVDGGAGALSVGGRTAGATAAGSSAGPFSVRPGRGSDDGLQLSPEQRAAYEGLDPDTQRAYRETLQLAAAFGFDASGTASPGAAPAAQPPVPALDPAAADQPVPVGATVPTAGPGPATRADFLRRAEGSAASQEPFRVRTSDDVGARRSPLVRRTTDHRGPSGGDPPPTVADAPPFTLLPGTVVPAVLVTGINSELPGDVVAQVERDVFDSATLRHVLIPRGTRLVGSYDDQIAYGQNRALVAWTTMVFPDGRTVALPGLPGVDLRGASGLQDRVDRHVDRVFGVAVALAAVGTGLALATPESDGVDLSPQTVASAQVAIELSRVATQVLRRELDVQPTVTVRPGYRLLVFLARAMEFDGPYVPSADPGRFRRFSR